MAGATVIIELEGTGEIELVPTLGAMEYLQKRYGNFQKVYDGLSNIDAATFTDVVMAGCISKKPDKGNTQAAIFATGFFELMPHLVKFITLLLNGGKEPDEEKTEDSDNPKAE